MSRKYWIECVEIGASDISLELTKEQIESIADSVESGYENYGMSHDHDQIGRGGPDPYKLDQENKSLKLEIARLERDISSYRKSVARRRNVEENNVWLENGEVRYEPR